ncbi:MAG: hypothetical protein Q9227_000082 [Pyrenula ochraceoflavens]
MAEHVSKAIPERRIKRKEVPTISSNDTNSSSCADDISNSSKNTDNLILQSPSLASTADGSERNFGLVQSPTSLSTASNASLVSSPSSQRWKNAWGESRHFLGGLLHHPYESTKHYTILRHSHGLVYYIGSKTSIAISIFSDAPLPTDRRLFLQNKGWSGQRGMKLKAALRTNNSWIEVTPSTAAEHSQLRPADERAWQRDIVHFKKKAAKEKLQHHVLRETHVVRVPAEAQDGYFRIILTKADSRKVLCPSPVFRLASTSMSASSIRGASLTTMPVEIGIKVGSMVANSMAHKAVEPVTDQLSSQMQQYVPSSAQTAATTAYGMTGAQDKLESANERFDQTRDNFTTSLTSEYDHEISVLDRPNIIGNDSGPSEPFPIRFESKIVKGTGRSTFDLGMPTANLRSAPHELKARLSGLYFGWASFPSAEFEDLPSGQWREAIISAGLCPYSDPKIAPKEIIKVHLLHDFEDQSLVGARLAVVVMSFLRPNLPLNSDSLVFEMARDISITQASLARENWLAEAGLEQIKRIKSSRSMSERYVDARQAGQKQFDRVPLHKLGVRTPGAAWKDRLISKGGLYVKRD